MDDEKRVAIEALLRHRQMRIKGIWKILLK